MGRGGANSGEEWGPVWVVEGTVGGGATSITQPIRSLKLLIPKNQNQNALRKKKQEEEEANTGINKQSHFCHLQRRVTECVLRHGAFQGQRSDQEAHVF